MKTTKNHAQKPYMARAFDVMAKCFFIASILLIFSGLIYIAVNYANLPETLGCHFDSEGGFDVFWNKKYAFLHPVIAQTLLLVIFYFLSFLSLRLAPSKRISAKGHDLISGAVSTFCALIALSWNVLFTIWINCVVKQTPLNLLFPKILTYIDFFAFFALIVFMAVVRKKQKSRPDRDHCDAL